MLVIRGSWSVPAAARGFGSMPGRSLARNLDRGGAAPALAPALAAVVTNAVAPTKAPPRTARLEIGCGSSMVIRLRNGLVSGRDFQTRLTFSPAPESHLSGVWGQGQGRERLVRAPGLLPCLQPSIPCGIAAPDARLTGKSTNLPSWVLPISLSPTRTGAGRYRQDLAFHR